MRDAQGKDLPLIFTRDGRLLPEGAGGAVHLLGGSFPASPVIAARDFGFELMGLSFFDGVDGTSAAEDTLLSTPDLSFWHMQAAPAESYPVWAMAGGNPARTGRVMAAGPVEISSSGSAIFVEAYPYPNPAASSVTWRVRSDSPDRVKIEIFDLEGQRIWSDTMNLDGFSPGERELSLDEFAPGLYFFRIQSETSGRQEMGRLAVIR
jgi:hypothetical protein